MTQTTKLMSRKTRIAEGLILIDRRPEIPAAFEPASLHLSYRGLLWVPHKVAMSASAARCSHLMTIEHCSGATLACLQGRCLAVHDSFSTRIPDDNLLNPGPTRLTHLPFRGCHILTRARMFAGKGSSRRTYLMSMIAVHYPASKVDMQDQSELLPDCLQLVDP